MTELISAGWLLDGRGNQYQNWGMVIENSRIKEMGEAKELQRKYPEAKRFCKKNWIVAPGYLDAHDHGRAISPFWFGARDCPLEIWIPQLGKVAVPAYEAALYDGVLLAKSGVTTVVHCHNISDVQRIKEELLDTVRGYTDAGIRVVLCPPYTDQNALIYGDRSQFMASLDEKQRDEFSNMVTDAPLSLTDYLKLVEELKEEMKDLIHKEMAAIQLHPVGGQWCSDEALAEIKAYAQKNRMRIHMHLLETKYQKIYGQKNWGKSIVAHFEEIGFLGPWLTIAHAVWLTEEDRQILKRNQVKVVTNPSSNLRLRSGIFSLQEMVQSGITCSVGLDGCALDDDQDYGRELRLALYNPAVSGIQAQVTHDQIAEMAYQGGSKAIGESFSSGELAVGKLADFICYDGEKLDFPYADDSLTWQEKIIQKGTRDKIDAVYCGGRKIVEQQHSLTANEEETGMILSRFAEEKKTERNSVSDSLLQAIAQFYQRWETGG